MMREINWENYALVAYGLLGWSPHDFWRSTPLDFHLSFKAWKKTNDVPFEEDFLNRADLDALIQNFKKQGL